MELPILVRGHYKDTIARYDIETNILPQLVFDNIPINFVDSHKHLGVTFSSTGQWHSHIENIVLSATKILGIMRKLKYSISRNALNQMYMSFL